MLMVGMLGAALPVAAYDPIGYASRDYQYANDLLNSFQNRFQYDLVDPVRKRVYREQRAGATSATTQRSAAPAVVPTTFRPTGAAGGGVDKLVSAYPASMQGQVRTEFRKLLDGFRQIEKQFGLLPNDVAVPWRPFWPAATWVTATPTFPTSTSSRWSRRCARPWRPMRALRRRVMPNGRTCSSNWPRWAC